MKKWWIQIQLVAVVPSEKKKHLRTRVVEKQPNHAGTRNLSNFPRLDMCDHTHQHHKCGDWSEKKMWLKLSETQNVQTPAE